MGEGVRSSRRAAHEHSIPAFTHRMADRLIYGNVSNNQPSVARHRDLNFDFVKDNRWQARLAR